MVYGRREIVRRRRPAQHRRSSLTLYCRPGKVLNWTAIAGQSPLMVRSDTGSTVKCELDQGGTGFGRQLSKLGRPHRLEEAQETLELTTSIRLAAVFMGVTSCEHHQRESDRKK